LFHANGTLRNKWNNAWNKPNLLTPDNKFVCVIIISIIIFIGNYHPKNGQQKNPDCSGLGETLAG
jgi:hypothetical protein